MEACFLLWRRCAWIWHLVQGWQPQLYVFRSKSLCGHITSNPTKNWYWWWSPSKRFYRYNGNMIIDNNLNVKGNLGGSKSNSPYPFHINRNGVGYYQSWQGNWVHYIPTWDPRMPVLVSGYGTNLEITNGSTFQWNLLEGNVGISNNYAFSPNASLVVEREEVVLMVLAAFSAHPMLILIYSTAEDTYLRGGKVSTKLILNDYGGRVTVGTNIPGNAQLNIASHRTGTNANGLSINQNTQEIREQLIWFIHLRKWWRGEYGNESWSWPKWNPPTWLVNLGLKGTLQESTRSSIICIQGQPSNTAGHFMQNDVNSTQVIGVRAVANGKPKSTQFKVMGLLWLIAKGYWRLCGRVFWGCGVGNR